MLTRTSFLKGLTGLTAFAAGAGLVEEETEAAAFPAWRFGRTQPPRLSISVPETWFFTEHLTDVGDPVQLFAISNREIIAPHANVHGTVNPELISSDGTLVLGSGFVITADMAVYESRTSARPPVLHLADMSGGESFGDLGLKYSSWSHVGETFGIQIFVWIGDDAAAADIETLDAVLASLTFDQPL